MEQRTQILITGDFAPTRRVEALIKSEGSRNLYGSFSPYLEHNDLTVTNLECPLTLSSNRLKKIGPNLKADPKCVSALVEGNFNLVTLANNHIMDYGLEGLTSTIEVCKANHIDVVGAGADLKSARQPYYFKKGDLTIAIINVAENEFANASFDTGGANPIDLPNNYYDIKTAKQIADQLILIVHGGHEYYNLPSPEVVKRYRFFIEIGVNVVIAHHPHYYSGYERYNGGLIFYSLGNFVFEDMTKSKGELWHKGYAVRLTLDKLQDADFEIIPYVQSKETVGIRLLNSQERKSFDEDITSLNKIISSKTLLNNKWQERVAEKSRNYNKHLIPFENRYIKHLAYLVGFLSKRHKLKLLNYTRCESHKEMLVSALERDLKIGI